MSLQVFNKEVDVAVIGLTNSGKSTFITSMIDRSKFGDPELLKKLCANDGGLTKVTTFYALTECDSAAIDKVDFHKEFIEENSKKTIEILGKLKIDVHHTNDDGDEASQISAALKVFSEKLEGDLAYTIDTINKKGADKIIRYIKIRVPATKAALKLMSTYGFNTVVLRDTRGFLDESISTGKKSPNLADSGLGGIQACVLMNGRDSVMPNLARDMYGDFVKSIFESVPTFIIEQSGYLAAKLEDMEGEELEKAYNTATDNPKVLSRNFTEIGKFLEHLGVVNKDGEATNQLIEANKRQLLLPEIAELKNKVKDYASNEYKLYSICETEVFRRILKSLSDFRELLNRIIHFLDDSNKVADFQKAVLDVFEEMHFSDIVTDYINGDRNNSVYVRPITNDFDMSNRLEGLIKSPLLGPRGGITSKRNGQHYDYGHTGTFAVTTWKFLNEIIVDFNLIDNYKEVADVIVNSIEASEQTNKNVVSAYLLEVKQCLKYVLQNDFTDTRATFSGYYFAVRNKVVDSIDKVKAQWKGYEPKYGTNAIDKVFLKNVRDVMDREGLTPSVNLTRVSQLYIAFKNMIQLFFSCVSSNHNYPGISNEVSV